MSGISGSLLTVGSGGGSGAVISCPHGGRATPTAGSSDRSVLINGAPVATAAHSYAVVGCPHTVGGVPEPCAAVRWSADATGITVDGTPVLLDTSAAQCVTAAFVPQGPPFVQPAQREVTFR
ncbi:hypothetical protein [Streptomyces sp. NBC_00057]|uniref:hypothetical protein n=1 Tax=Streptomyces sp. NBC_00057 TaxID=2975634 RepID=UPI0032559A6D